MDVSDTIGALIPRDLPEPKQFSPMTSNSKTIAFSVHLAGSSVCNIIENHCNYIYTIVVTQLLI